MSSLGLAAYVLVWPILTAIILVLIIGGVIRDALDARKSGEDVI